jgi:hypothetical protein
MRARGKTGGAEIRTRRNARRSEMRRAGDAATAEMGRRTTTEVWHRRRPSASAAQMRGSNSRAATARRFVRCGLTRARKHRSRDKNRDSESEFRHRSLLRTTRERVTLSPHI